MSEPPSEDPLEAPAATAPPAFLSGWTTAVCSLVVAVLIGAYTLHFPPPLGRLDRPEQALERLVSRELDLRDALLRGPGWERRLYALVSGFDDTLDDPIAWYEELTEDTDAAVSPRARLHRVLLLAEAGLGDQARAAVAAWDQEELPARLADWARAAYGGAPPDAETGRRLLAEIREGLPPGWFADTLVARLAHRLGDAGVQAEASSAIARRGGALLWRWRALTVGQLALTALGVIALARAVGRRATVRLADALLPPPWPARDGYGLFVRGVTGFLVVGWLPPFLLPDQPLLGGAASIAAAVPMVWWTLRYLSARGAPFAATFGLAAPARGWPSLAPAVVILVGLGIAGEAAISAAAAGLGLHAHWADGFPEDLLWDPAGLVALSAVDTGLWTPFVEELTFRGILYGTLRRRLGPWPAALASAAVFAAAHGYGAAGFASVLWSGVLWALAYERTRSLLPAILAHAVNNLLVDVTYLWLLRL